MKIDFEDYLSHFGVPGMRWGHRKSEEEGSGSKGSRDFSDIFDPKKSVEEKNAAILKKSPHAAVLNYGALKKSQDLDDLPPEKTPEEIAARNKKIRNIAIGVGIGVTVIAGAVLYAKNKKAVDGAVWRFLKKFGDQPLNEGEIPLGKQKAYRALGLNVKTKPDAVKTDFVVAWMGHDKNRFNPLTPEGFSKLSDDDLELKAGQVFNRICSSEKSPIRYGGYVSFEPDDANRYKAFLPALRRANNFGEATPAAFNMELEAVGNIRSPSAKKRVKILADLIANDADFGEMFKYPLGGIPTSDDALIKAGRKTPMQIALETYNRVATKLCDKSSPITTRYLEEVTRLGYNALVDDNDAGRLARNPMIILDPAALTIKAVKQVTPTEVKRAADSLIPMTGENFENTKALVKNSPEYALYAKAVLDAMQALGNDN